MAQLFQPTPCPLIAILHGLTPEEAPRAGGILFEAGFRMLEVPLNRPRALEAMQALLREAPADAVVGACGVLRPQDVDAVSEAGGRIAAPPHCAEDVIAHAAGLGLLSLPGVATPTEAFRALAAGAHGLMLFPAGMIGTASFAAFQSVLPERTPLFPVGGITAQNMAEYMAAGATGFGIGSHLYKAGMDGATLRENAAAFMSERQHLLRTWR